MPVNRAPEPGQQVILIIQNKEQAFDAIDVSVASGDCKRRVLGAILLPILVAVKKQLGCKADSEHRDVSSLRGTPHGHRDFRHVSSLCNAPQNQSRVFNRVSFLYICR
jgi:hypothetical protein